MVRRIAALAILCAFAAADADAAGFILSPTGASATSEFVPGDFDIGNTIDQSGLSAGFVSGVTDFDIYLASGPTHTSIAETFEWFTESGVTTAVVTYALGATYVIDAMALWVEESAGVAGFDLLSSTDGTNFSPVVTNIVPVDNPAADYLAEEFHFSQVSASHMRLDIFACPQGASTFKGCGLGEVAFSVVPEPSTALLCGVGLLALIRMRRRR